MVVAVFNKEKQTVNLDVVLKVIRIWLLRERHLLKVNEEALKRGSGL